MVWSAVFGLLLLYGGLALSASLNKSAAFDEVGHLTAGYSIWLNHDFRLDPANGDFAKRWAALPLLFSRPAFPPRSDDAWRQGEQHTLGFRFFFQDGNSAERLLVQGRAMIALLGLALGLAIFLHARSLFGTSGGLLALALFAFSPNMLAHGALITADLSVTLGLFAATICLWRLWHEVSWIRLALSLFIFGVLVLTKLSAIAIVPVGAVLAVVKIARGRPILWRLMRRRVVVRRTSQTTIIAGLALLHLSLGWGAIWLNYDFRYQASCDPSDPGLIFQRLPDHMPAISPVAAEMIAGSLRHHALPEGFLHGVQTLLSSTQRRPAFLNGRWWLGGRPEFFPWAFWLKTPPAILALLGFGVAGWLWRHRAAIALGSALYPVTPCLAIIGIYAAMAMIEPINIGHRHLLPVYPPIYVLAGSAAAGWGTAGVRRRLAVLGGAIWLAADSLVCRPDYLSYFNPVASRPAQGFRHLVDSSLDWGMELPSLKSWLDEHNAGHREPVFLAYFGTGSPDYYGIESERMPGFFDWRKHRAYSLRPGYYVISATLLEGLYTPVFGPWSSRSELEYQRVLLELRRWDETAPDPPARAELLKLHPFGYWQSLFGRFDELRFARLCAWLRNKRSPDAEIGRSLLVWRLGVETLHEALGEGPVELADPPT